MSATVRWHQSLAWKFFLRTAVAIILLAAAVLWVARNQSAKRSIESAEGGIKVSAQIMEKSFETQALILDAGLEVFTTYSANLAYIERQDFASVRDNLLQNLSNLKSDVAMVVRPAGALLSCTTDGHKQDYTDVGMVQMAMHPEEAAQQGEKGPSYRGYLRIEGGAFKGFYHGVARRLQTPGGAFIGVMLVANRLNDDAAVHLRRQSLFRLQPTDPAAHVTLVAEDQVLGTTVAEGPGRAQLTQWLKGAEAEAARGALLSQPRSRPFRLILEGQDQLAILAQMRGINARDFRTAELITMPLEPFVRPFQVIQRAILAVGLGGVLVAVFLALRTARKVTAPLAALTKATSALAEGARPEIPHLDTQDEVGYLTQAFRALLSELQAKEELLSALEKLRGGDARGMSANLEHFPGTHAGLTAVDLEATMALPPGASQAMTQGAAAVPVKRKLTLREGEIFAGRYRIENILGKGGMGIVMKARDQQLDEDVAIKVIRPEHDLTEGFLDQLKQEIKLARKISHRFVLRTHDFGESQGIPFVSMEYLKGVTLKQLLDDRGTLPLPLVLRIGRQVAEGLEAAHAEGVVHRDIKPLNVLFDTRGDAKLMDFGLAAPVATKGTNEEGQVFGTPRYMAPEQVRGERVDPRTDLYALGVMLYELATGQAPYQAPDITDLLRQHLSAPIPDARGLKADLPPAFGNLLQRLMAKRIEDRPVGAGEVAESLKLIAAGGAG
jgi:serine/threonine-protein kinase